jgi:hypothetical protein
MKPISKYLIPNKLIIHLEERNAQKYRALAFWKLLAFPNNADLDIWNFKKADKRTWAYECKFIV